MKRIHFIIIGLIAAAAVSCGKQSPEFALTSETFNIVSFPEKGGSSAI